METTIGTPNWERAADAVEARITERGAKIRAVARNAGVDPTTLWKLRRGHGGLLSPRARSRIDESLGWPAGTVDRIANEPDFQPPADPVPADRDRLAAIESQLETLQGQVARLVRMFEQ